MIHLSAIPAAIAEPHTGLAASKSTALMRLRRYWPRIAIAIIITAGAIFRLTVYGDPRPSVPTRDTASYVKASRVPLLSRNMWTGRRLFTTNLIYKVFPPPKGLEIAPTEATGFREIQPGFDQIALLQVCMSIVGWSLLAVAFAWHQKNPLIEILSTVLILAFGYVPQIADWDSVLGSEALTYSLFMAAFGLILLLVFRLDRSSRVDAWTVLLIVASFICLFFWNFLRDANLPAIWITAGMTLATLAIPRFRGLRAIQIAALALIALAVGGTLTAARSNRSQIQLEHIFTVVIAPSPARAAFAEKLGMPAPGSPEYLPWIKQDAPSVYLRFLAAFPGFTASTYVQGAYMAAVNYIQPYFRTPRSDWRNRLLPVGEVLHGGFVFIVLDVMLLVILGSLAVRNPANDIRAWTWLAVWLILCAAGTLFVSVFGDIVAINRHSLLSIALFRLFFWLFFLVIVDQLFLTREART